LGALTIGAKQSLRRSVAMVAPKDADAICEERCCDGFTWMSFELYTFPAKLDLWTIMDR
jgi:hypothetical protein